MSETKTDAVALPFKAETGTDIAVHRDTQAINHLLELAVSKNLDVESMEKLITLHERVADRMASSEFADAMAKFQAECPPIKKTSKVTVGTGSGVRYSYDFASLDHIAATVNPILTRLGLSYTWDSDLNDRQLKCVCTLRHVNGHSVTASFTCIVDGTKGMSDQQKHASTLSYARRQSLTQVLGLTTCDPDTDAAPTDTITDEQVADITSLVDEVNADLPKFLKYMAVEALEGIRAADYTRAIRALEAKRGKP